MEYYFLVLLFCFLIPALIRIYNNKKNHVYLRKRFHGDSALIQWWLNRKMVWNQFCHKWILCKSAHKCIVSIPGSYCDRWIEGCAKFCIEHEKQRKIDCTAYHLTSNLLGKDCMDNRHLVTLSPKALAMLCLRGIQSKILIHIPRTWARPLGKFIASNK